MKMHLRVDVVLEDAIDLAGQHVRANELVDARAGIAHDIEQDLSRVFVLERSHRFIGAVEPLRDVAGGMGGGDEEHEECKHRSSIRRWGALCCWGT